MAGFQLNGWSFRSFFSSFLMKVRLPTIKRGLLFFLLVILGSSCSKMSFDNTKGTMSSDEPIATDPIGTPTQGMSMIENFVQNEHLAKMDILFIDDNSASMAVEQEKLGSRLGTFLSSLTNIDWQIGITTTDTSDGKFGIKGSLLKFKPDSYILTAETENYENLFLNTIVRQETLNCNSSDCPSPSEQPLKAIIQAIDKREKENKGFFRPEADLAIIVLSDEDEMSNGSDSSATKPQQVANKFKSAFGNSKKLSVYGVIIVPQDSRCLDEQELQATAYYGTFVSDLAHLTNGITSSICDKDYGPGLMQIGSQIRNLAVDLELQTIPQTQSVKIELVPEDKQVKWEVRGKKIHFITPPKRGTHISVSYVTAAN